MRQVTPSYPRSAPLAARYAMQHGPCAQRYGAQVGPLLSPLTELAWSLLAWGCLAACLELSLLSPSPRLTSRARR